MNSRAVRVLLAFAALTVPIRAQNRARLAEVELVGPVSNVVLEVPHQGRTRIEGDLGQGESRHLSVPIALQSDAGRIAPLVSFDAQDADLVATGRARFLSWRTGPAPLDALPAGLRARARPALAETNVAVSRAAPLVLVVALCLALALRRKPVLALLAALLASLSTFPLVARPERDAGSAVTLYDGDLETSAWRRVDAAFDAIDLPQGVVEFELWTEPPDALVTWRTGLDPARPWRAEAHGARLFLASVFEAGPGRIARGQNAFVPFDRVWLRTDGTWSAHPAWGTDVALAPDAQPGSPPGWLASNLPQGVPILIAHAAGGSARAQTWVRQSGL